MADVPYNFIDLTGQKFNRLTVIKRLGTKYIGEGKQSATLWECLCDCGNSKNVTSALLRNEKVKSCGCLRREFGRNSVKKLHISNIKLTREERSLKKLFHRYTNSAKYMKREFDFTLESFKEITSKNCFYCSAPPSKVALWHPTKILNGYYVYNGIDRIDSKIGYKLDNCVPCCFQCNAMKSNYSLDSFLEKVTQIYKNFVEKR